MVYKNKIPIKKSWGQNFLIDPNTISNIIDLIDPRKEDIILEIGPGTGNLTEKILEKDP
ncbi:MAG: 16S rRNA methyltransferase, partial [Halobacteriovoraceae bacterium]|nr:16S rRNA methyltransferase [Halobacteriovoraceae bacterium]